MLRSQIETETNSIVGNDIHDVKGRSRKTDQHERASKIRATTTTQGRKDFGVG